MGSRLVDVVALGRALEEFAAERQWARYHSPKNLAMAVANETGELVELFQWLTEPESYAVAREPQTARAVRDELADVLIYLVRLAWQLDVDLDEAVRDKLVRNARKYPPSAEALGSGGSVE